MNSSVRQLAKAAEVLESTQAVNDLLHTLRAPLDPAVLEFFAFGQADVSTQ